MINTDNLKELKLIDEEPDTAMDDDLVDDEVAEAEGESLPDAPAAKPKKIAITVKDVSISYQSMRATSIKSLIKGKGFSGKDRHLAVDNVSFEVEKGQIIGITGRNGAGKSTLLRAIGGIFAANEGTIDLHGNSVSLLAIGVGFQKELTGRENIMLSGLLLGFSEKEIKEKMDRIIKFSELGSFIDKPVKTYSSGMYSKLAFSVTAILKTDIMLVDEVLSVGDRHFKKKSLHHMKKLIKSKKRTVLMVSHSEKTLRSLCHKVLWLDHGKLVMFGDANEVLDEYEKFMEGEERAAD